MDISKDKNPVKWFEFEPGEKYQIRWLSSYDLEGLSDDAFLKNNLVDWKGVNNSDGPIECNQKNKKAFAASFNGQQRLLWMVKKSIDMQGWLDLDAIKKK